MTSDNRQEYAIMGSPEYRLAAVVWVYLEAVDSALLKSAHQVETTMKTVHHAMNRQKDDLMPRRMRIILALLAVNLVIGLVDLYLLWR